MSVRALLRTKSQGPIAVETTATVADAVRLMMERGIGGVTVVDGEGALVGFVSEREVVDAVNRNEKDVRGVPVTSVMRRPAPTCDSDEPITVVMARMTRERLRHLVALDEGRAAGVISVGDLVKHRLEELETEARVLRDYVAGQRASR